jgi:steroid 5-alpha reductase family enzyme
VTSFTALAGPGNVLPLAAAAVVLSFLLLWILSVVMKDVSIVDPAWGPAYVLVALVGLLAGDGDAARRVVLFAIVAIWGLRLGVHLGRRKLGEIGEEDKRYAAMREKRGDGGFALYSLGIVFGLQAFLVLVVALPVQVGAASGDGLDWLVVPGVLLWAIGFFFEAVGDYQLDQFKQDPDNKGKVMDQGLWRYTRHPNYFGDTCVWWGIWLVALTAGGAWWTFVGPVVMTLFLTKFSGAGLMEKTIGSRREGYDEYVKRTSGFIPLPPKS